MLNMKIWPRPVLPVLFAVIGALIVFIAVPGLSQLPTAQAQGALFGGDRIKEVTLVVDKTAGAAKLLPERDRKRLVTLFDDPVIYLNLKVILDGSDETAVTTQLEESTVPEPAPCGQNNYGRMIMSPGLQYIVDSAYDYKGQTVNLSALIFPGERTAFPYNDVSCNYYSDDQLATFEVTGFFYVHINPVKNGFEVQLRPITPDFKSATGILTRSPLKKLHDKLNAQTVRSTLRAKTRMERFRKNIDDFLKKF